MKLKKELIPIFPINLGWYEYPDFEKDKEALIEAVRSQEKLQDRDIDSGLALRIKHNIKESHPYFLSKNSEEHPVLNNLSQFFFDSVWDIVKELTPPEYLPPQGSRINIPDCWYHITNDKGYHEFHQHAGYSWSGIFYLQTSECNEYNGVNNFYDTFRPKIARDVGAFWSNEDVASIEPKEGYLLIFPSWIYHSAFPYEGDEDRIVISFNALIEPAEFDLTEQKEE